MKFAHVLSESKALAHEILTSHGFEHLANGEYHHPDVGWENHPGDGVHEDLEKAGFKHVAHAQDGSHDDGDENEVSYHYYHHPDMPDHHLAIVHGSNMDAGAGFNGLDDDDGGPSLWSEALFEPKKDKHPAADVQEAQQLRLADKGDPDPDAPPPRSSGKAALQSARSSVEATKQTAGRAKYVGRTTQDLRAGQGGDNVLVPTSKNKFQLKSSDDVYDREQPLMVGKNKFSATGSYDLRPDLKPRPITYRQVFR